MAFLGRQGVTAPLTSADIPDSSITASKIATGAITAADVAADMATQAELDAKLSLAGGAMTGAITTNSTFDGVDIATRDGILTSTTTTAGAALPKAGGTMTGNIVMGDDTSIGIADDAERIEFDGAGDISLLGCIVGVGTASPSGHLIYLDTNASDTAGTSYGGIRFENYSNSNGMWLHMRHVSADEMGYDINFNRAATSGYAFMRCRSGDTADQEFLIRGDGNALADGSWTGGGADYAEYFESSDGSAIPAGTTVVLEDEKVRPATASEQPIGIVRPTGARSTVGNTASMKWTGKHLKDDYDAYIFEDYSQTEWEIETLDDDGKVVDKQNHTYQTDLIPADVTVPADAKITSKDSDGNNLKRRKVNSDFDSSLEYVSREDRDEWNIIGLLGQIPITKGQPVADTWIKMRDVSETVEMWFVK